MTDIEKLSIFPEKRIKPMDGLAVSADVWESAHQEHRDTARGHNAVLHGEGIITGLEVIANDPPNNLVYISPGAAIDREGNVIVVTERLAYDFGESSTGDLFLLLAQGSREIAGEEEGTVFIQKEFMVAARSTIAKRPSVELARVSRTAVGQPINNAGNPQRPADGELDLRYRNEIGLPVIERKRVLLVDFDNNDHVVKGLEALAKEARRSTDLRLLVESAASIPSDAGTSEVMLISFGSKALTKGRSEDLKKILANGGNLLVEATSEATFDGLRALFEESGVPLSAVADGHSVLLDPFCFSHSPIIEAEKVLIGRNVVLVHGSYATVWGGSLNGQPVEREMIRSAQEWGSNLLAYLMK